MTAQTPVSPRRAGDGASLAGRLLSRVIVGVDETPESREAVRQAARLTAGVGSLELLAAYQVVFPAAVSGIVVADYMEGQDALYEKAAEDALRRVLRELDRDVSVKVVGERPAAALLAEIERRQASLVVVGSHGKGRLEGIVLGSVATEIVHRAPCSVLVAHKPFPPRLDTIVVGIDGSDESAAAYAVAAELAERFEARLWPVAAHGGKPLDRTLVDAITTHREDSPASPVDALTTAAVDASLLVVGSRGLHGLSALGSVSERIAHQSPATTLIVRDIPGSRKEQ
jgi:nucleotide-binding universal stress UspA family protein